MLKVEEPTAVKMEQFVRRYEISRRENKEIAKGTSGTAQAATIKGKGKGKGTGAAQNLQHLSLKDLRAKLKHISDSGAVSYTHLTLPTIYSV